MTAAQHQDLLQWLSDNWVWIIAFTWFLGGFSAAEEWWRRTAKRRRKAAALRHKRRVELARAQAGLLSPYREGGPIPEPGLSAVPAAAVASPPAARPAVPGPCQHERIVPVITADGELVRWVCANYRRCDAVFPPDTALYEPGEAVS